MSRSSSNTPTEAPRAGEEQGRGPAEVAPLLPTPTLPTGGGAIRGIGEKFVVSPATGSASLSIPLPLSPGRGGLTPSLALSYDTGAGNGPFGLGWSLALPAITRKTERHIGRDELELGGVCR